MKFPQRADEGVAVLAADLAILVAVAPVETWLTHTALSLYRRPVRQTAPVRSGWQRGSLHVSGS